MPQACATVTPEFFSNFSIIARGQAEPPISTRRKVEKLQIVALHMGKQHQPDGPHRSGHRDALAFEQFVDRCAVELHARQDQPAAWHRRRERDGPAVGMEERHHGQSEGRRLLASLQRAAFADGADARRVRSLGAGHHHAGGAVLPCQRLDHRVLGADVGLPAGPAGHEARRRVDLRTARRRARHHDGRGADHLADAAHPHGEQQSQALDLAPRADRRLGLPARHDREIREELRRHRRACLGHDRDEPDRLDLRDQAGLRRERLREAARREVEAGRGAVHGRDEDRRRLREGIAVGRQDRSAGSR